MSRTTTAFDRPVFRRLAEAARRTLLLAAAVLACGSAAAAAEGLYLRVEAGEHSAGIRRIAISPDGALVATAGDDKTGRLWRAADRRLLATVRVPIGDGDQGRLYGVAFSPDGQQLAVAGTAASAAGPGRIDLFGASNGVFLRTLKLDAGNVVRLLWTRDGRHLVACLSGSHGVRIVAADSGRLAYAENFAAPCFGLAELSDGSVLASGWDGRIRHLRPDGAGWKAAAPIATEIADPQSIAVSPDGRHLAVGYRSRLPSGAVAVDVFDTAGFKLARRFTFSDLRGGSLGAVAWSRDGRTIAASGRADQGDGSNILKRIAWPQGTVASDAVAADTVQDMAAYGNEHFVVASSTGLWGFVPATGPVQPLGSSVADLGNADGLRADASLRAVAFGHGGTQGVKRFDLASRLLQADEGSGLDTPKRFSFSLQVTQWRDHLQPRIAGVAVAMDALEVSRAYALLPDGSGVLLGTSRTLRRFDDRGAQQWSVAVGSEVRSVIASADSRLLVTTQRDGSVRWWRASDGLPLLTLFVSVDGRWILWTEQGYYDAGVGGEALIGWHVNRAGGNGADFFSIAKFRDKYHRPDVIDRVLDSLDPQQALAGADAQRQARLTALASPAAAPAVPAAPIAPMAPAAPAVPAVPAAPIAPAAPVTPATPAEPPPAPVAAAPAPAVPAVEVVPDPHQKVLPPVLSVLTERSVQSASRALTVKFAVRAGFRPAETVVVRVDGRPVELMSLIMPAQQDGETQGQLTVVMPDSSAELAVLAKAGSLFSDPVFVSWRWRPPQQASAAPAAPAAASKPSPPVPAAARRARLFMVAIGVSEYARKEYNLGLPAKDARDFAAVMAAQSGRLYASVESRVLTDANATRAALLDAMRWLQTSAGANDTAMLFIAGHGVNETSGGYYFMTHDADADRLAATAVSESQIRASLSAIRGKAVLFADTCHAGRVIGTGAAVSNEISRFANSMTSAESGVIVFSASTGRQEAIELERLGNGAFTKALIDGLQGAADFRKEGMVTHQGLSYYLGQAVRKLSGNRQTPVTAVPVGVVDYPMVALSTGA